MLKSKMMSYITVDFQTKSDMRIGMMEWQNIVNEMATEFENAGAIRQTGCQIWNKEGVFRLGYCWEYADEKAFESCQAIFREAEILFKKRTQITWKVFSNRGVIFEDVMFKDIL